MTLRKIILKRLMLYIQSYCDISDIKRLNSKNKLRLPNGVLLEILLFYF